MDTIGLNVLLVEDEVAIRSLVKMEFDDLGYTTIAVGLVADARKVIAEQCTTLDLCILDLKLPDGSGLELLQEIKEKMPNVPVILMTGHGNKSTVLEALKRGAYDYIEKPFSISTDLFPIVNRASSTRKLQKENTSLNEQILHNSKLAALGELSATVLHDIRGPLSLIHVVCDDLGDELSDKGSIDSPFMQHSLEQIRKACDRIRKLGDHLRDYSRQDNNETQEFRPLETLLEDSLFLVEQKVRKHSIKVIKELDPTVVGMQIRCFPNKFEQVIMNLLSNACDAMAGEQKRVLTLSSRIESEYVYIDVSDSGNGIPKEIQDKIFENFFTTKPKGEGTGLGLSIVRNIVREHEGELMLKSEAGKGTTFTVRLPVACASLSGDTQVTSHTESAA